MPRPQITLAILGMPGFSFSTLAVRWTSSRRPTGKLGMKPIDCFCSLVNLDRW